MRLWQSHDQAHESMIETWIICTTIEMGKLRSVKDGRCIHKCYAAAKDQRGFNARQEVLRILASDLEHQIGESREDKACWRRTSALMVGTRRGLNIVEAIGDQK
jgi:hypothetical protein